MKQTKEQKIAKIDTRVSNAIQKYQEITGIEFKLDDQQVRLLTLQLLRISRNNTRKTKVNEINEIKNEVQ
jgi:hypothetical protein